ncbi:hypothetical protein GFC01_12245 [Desulfofundulus thermobenzoicus]|uniref:Uncharacterized protein n=1 Tax=Desulfofundulus thermobenzoicus TaxID=29376 RepID=A0A6N7IS98_9FIRM|nr:hypothetical protein [Desulfofundulus thermobenzoicus]MQL53015.1 hypothetical protein [Desulfofundulus thermobenzoicus]
MKDIRRPRVIRFGFLKRGEFPVPGVEIGFTVNGIYHTIRISDMFMRISQLDPTVIAPRKIKEVLFAEPNRDPSKPIDVFTDQLTQIDFWPLVTEGELQIWQQKNELALYHDAESMRKVLIKVLFEEHRKSPETEISFLDLAALMKTTMELLAPEVQALEKAGLIKRLGEENHVHPSDWLRLTEQGVLELEQYKGIKLSESYQLLTY